jgi:pimeloyl-ACP methyl ester carboxylesterase
MPPRTSYARARDGVSIAYQVTGEGDRALVFVPQTFSAVEALWEHPTVARFFERLGNLGRVVLYDRRGTGMSDRSGRPATLEEHADDLHAVMDAAGVERADLMAIMEGGPMAMVFAASAPDRVRSLVLFATFARTVVADDYEAGWSEEERAAARSIVSELTSLGLDVRAGLHTGEVEMVGDDVAGLAVHIAARVVGEAAPGGVVASSTVRDLVVGSGLRFEERGRRKLRGVPGEWGLWEVTG